MNEVKLYLSHHCKYCQKIVDHLEQVKSNFAKINMVVRLIFYEEDKSLFIIAGFDSVPVLAMPNRRPFHPIDPDYLIDSDKFYRIALGTVPHSAAKHKTAIARLEKGIIHNPKFAIA